MMQGKQKKGGSAASASDPSRRSGQAVIALIPNDIIGQNMAGPGIRYWEFARVLSQFHSVHLIMPPFVPVQSDTPSLDFPAHFHDCENQALFRRLVEACDVIITRGVVLTAYPFLSQLGKPLLLDMYNPFLLEGLQQAAADDDLHKIMTFERNLEAINAQLQVADFVLCASEKQRDYWLGMLSALGRVNPATHDQDHSLRRLIDVVPFGLPRTPPQKTEQVLKGVYPGIAAEDKVILWGGGIWNWLDANTLIRAMAQIGKQRPDVKLFFMGIKRPFTAVVSNRAINQAIALSQELNLYDQTIFFNEWVPYEKRQNYLLEADIGVSLHLDHIETRFSFRTRLLDYLWAGLPTLATKGDVMGEMMAAHQLARLVTPRDVADVAQTILEMVDKPALRTNLAAQFTQVAAQYQWPVVARPLIEFCDSPELAADNGRFFPHTHPTNTLSRLLRKSWQAIRLGGVKAVTDEIKSYLQWLRNKG